jgi:PRTRC genetic system protein E
MFTELMPIIGRRPVTITVAPENGELIRVTVIPHSLKTDKEVNDSIPYSGKDEIAPIPSDAIKALTRALSLTGTPEEIDAGLAQNLASFTASHVDLQKTFDQAKEEIAQAVRAIKEREERKKKDRDEKLKAKSKNPGPATASVAVSDGDSDGDDEGAKENKSEPTAKEPVPANLGLFQ